MPTLAIQGWFDFKDIYDKIVAECRPSALLVELGVWKGGSLCYLGLIAKNANKGLRVIGVDKFTHEEWDGYAAIQRRDRDEFNEKRSVERQCRDNLLAFGVSDFVHLIKSDSIAVTSEFDDESVDFVFMDDTHSSEFIAKEITAWLPKMRRPSIMGGHDYPGNIRYGVKSHFHEVLDIGNSWLKRIE